MEPPNLHQPQEQFTGYFSSLLSLPPPDNKPTPTLPSTNTTSTHFINSQNLMLSSNNISYHNYHNHHQLAGPSSRDGYSWPPPPHRSSMNVVDPESFVANDLLFSKIKDEIMPESFPKLSDDLSIYGNSSNYFTPTGFSADQHHQFYPSSHQHPDGSNRKGTNHFLNSGSAEDSSCSSRSYSHVMPSINVLTSDLCSSLVSSSLDLNLRAADHHHHHHLNLSSSSYEGIPAGSSRLNSNASRNHFIGDSPAHSSNNTSKTSGTEDISLGRKSTTKRSISTFSGPNSSSSKNVNPSDDNKKPRSTSRNSCPPLKVRKEKLGDRIAALQRLVAPYGKTDTASVLTEAIGYIQFLHDQVQTLSVPYMRSSPNNKQNNRSILIRNSSEEDHHGKRESTNKDLTSRGLCLVPQSFASYLNGFNVGI